MTRKWMSGVFLRLPGALRSLRRVPVLASVAHRLSQAVLPVDEKVWVKVEHGAGAGLWMELNPRTGESYLRGDVEPAIQAVLLERLKPGMVFYDLGANIGFFSLLGARLVGPEGKVFAFEPDGENAARLRANVERNRLRNVTVIEAGVWSENGRVEFVAADVGSPDRGTGRFEPSSQGSLMECVALDYFVGTAPVPDVIKCDVEGAEVEVFKGAKYLLKMAQPIVLCEMHSEENGRFLRNRFTTMGYKTKSLDASHVLALPS